MRYYARVGDREYVVDIEENQILVDGEAVDVDIEQSGVDELYSVIFGGRSYELLIEPRRYTYDITLKGVFYSVQVEDERSRRMNASRKMALPGGELAIIAPIPGLVVKVLVVDGEEIAEGQPLVLLEAMKMENELCAVRAGRVKQVKVAAGQRVEQKAVLIVLE